jgi:uncharacterized DUF497 family protein
MQYYNWNDEKNEKLKKERNISFEQVIFHIETGDLLDVVRNPKKKYKNQKIFIVNINDYAYLVPFVEEEKEIFLKTIIPSRKATKNYLKEE